MLLCIVPTLSDESPECETATFPATDLGGTSAAAWLRERIDPDEDDSRLSALATCGAPGDKLTLRTGASVVAVVVRLAEGEASVFARTNAD